MGYSRPSPQMPVEVFDITPGPLGIRAIAPEKNIVGLVAQSSYGPIVKSGIAPVTGSVVKSNVGPLTSSHQPSRRLMPVPPPAQARAVPRRRARERTHLELPQVDLVAGTPGELRHVLQRCVERSGRTGGQLATAAGIHRSQLHYLTKQDSLPRKPEQIKKLLIACNLSPVQIRIVLEQWAQLDRLRGEQRVAPVPEASPAVEETGPPLTEARLAEAVSAGLRSLQVTAPARSRWVTEIRKLLMYMIVLVSVTMLVLMLGLTVVTPDSIHQVLHLFGK